MQRGFLFVVMNKTVNLVGQESTNLVIVELSRSLKNVELMNEIVLECK
jgi:hypothetical protein